MWMDYQPLTKVILLTCGLRNEHTDMKLSNCIALTLGIGIVLAGCKTQSPQTSSQQLPPASSPAQPSLPGTPSTPSLPGAPSLPSSSPGSPNSNASQQSSQQKTGQTAADTYGARPGSEQRKSADIPNLDNPPGGDGASGDSNQESANAQQELLDVLADIDATLEQAANSPNASEEQQARIEQYQEVLGDIEISVESGDLDPQALEALLDVLSDLEETIAAAAQSQNSHSGRDKNNRDGDDIPITITIAQVAILQDLINIIGIPGATVGAGIPSLPSVGIPAGLPRTGGEKLGDLDATLEASIGVFDGMILSERVGAQGKPGEFEEEVYSGGSEGLFEEGNLEEGDGSGNSQQKAQVPPMPGSEQSGSQSQSKGSGGGGSANQSAIPDDIPDGRDDDIVARQIREAASNEKDPELREKLWEEYRRYRRGK